MVDRSTIHSAAFSPEAANGPAVRRFVASAARAWDADALADDAALCATELATNAMLHARQPFTVTVRRWPGGIRVDVLDSHPEQLAVPVPRHGSASDLTLNGTTGRGLQIVAALATRWGVATSTDTKTVWAELTPEGGSGSDPILTLGHHPVPPQDSVSAKLLGLPVRAAVASGVQLDELVRELQLGDRAARLLSDTARAEFDRLLDQSAPARLSGRHAALRAAGRGEDRFDLDVLVSRTALEATSRVGVTLSDLATRLGLAATVSEEVAAFRAWVVDETVHQQDGSPPRPCPL